MSARFRVIAPTFAEPEADAHFDAPPGFDGTPAPGQALAELLARGLAERDVPPRNRWVTPQGHAFDVQLAGQRFDVTVALEDRDEDGAWIVEAEPRRGLLPRRTDPQSPALTHLRNALREVLDGDSRIEDVRVFP
jgi:hypothetical protein